MPLHEGDALPVTDELSSEYEAVGTPDPFDCLLGNFGLTGKLRPTLNGGKHFIQNLLPASPPHSSGL